MVRQVFAEVNAILGGREPTYDDFDKFEYTTAVFKETLRMFPPVWGVGRDCSEPTNLHDFHVSPGVRTLRRWPDLVVNCSRGCAHRQMRVTMFIYGIHYNPRYYPEPHKFVPSRFDPHSTSPVPACAWAPFSLGRRGCLGNKFALVRRDSRPHSASPL